MQRQACLLPPSSAASSSGPAATASPCAHCSRHTAQLYIWKAELPSGSALASVPTCPSSAAHVPSALVMLDLSSAMLDSEVESAGSLFTQCGPAASFELSSPFRTAASAIPSVRVSNPKMLALSVPIASGSTTSCSPELSSSFIGLGSVVATAVSSARIAPPGGLGIPSIVKRAYAHDVEVMPAASASLTLAAESSCAGLATADIPGTSADAGSGTT
mmetsp:Transcript_12543/g.41136  ORF Transcript_12543/g.41136 Transcript_12543/m.41136 type:complete len:217 (-) Transcript_12543:23-673(-)